MKSEALRETRRWRDGSFPRQGCRGGARQLQLRRRHSREARQGQALDAGLIGIVEGMLDAVRQERLLRPQQHDTQ